MAGTVGHTSNCDRPVRILLVEDSLGDIRLIRESLNRSGLKHVLTVFEDGEQALSMLEQRDGFEETPPPDLVLLDLNLPRVDGVAVLELFRKAPLDDIPVVLLSSSQAPRDIARAKDVRRGLYIVKPMDLEEFLRIGERVKAFLLQTEGRESWAQ